MILLRFLFMAPSFLVPKHEIFGRLSKAMSERRDHFTSCIATDPNDGLVPEKFGSYRISTKQCDLFLSLAWDQMDMANHSVSDPSEGGFLALRHCESAVTFDQVQEADFFVVESVLHGIGPWFDRLLLGGGYSPTPAAGHTWLAVVDEQARLVRYIDGLPESERDVWRAWARTNFKENALRRAATYAESLLKSSEPGDEVFGAFLPDGATFFENIARRLRDAAPVASIRRAFPNFMPAMSVSLPGTSAAPGGGRQGGPPSGGDGGTSDGKKHQQPKAPGAGLAKMLNNGNLFLAGGVLDVDGIANELGVDVHSKCWPVLFTTKTGKDKLQVCLDPKHHGGLDAAVHKIPSNFNRVNLSKKFGRAANPDELKEAKWNKKRKL